ncbi:MAG: DUF4105 domain-containing protein [Myxococcales bacterium]|nr:DUF4105 domain-containing protein [Myxococcales bacterium]
MKALFASPLLVASGAWSLTALWIDGPASRGIAGLLLMAFSLAALLVLIRVRPFWRAAGVYSLLFACVLLWWLALAPSNDRDWQPDVARTPKATIAGDLLTIENIRNFDYRSETDYDEHWETRTYDLSKLRGADIFFSHWGSPMIAHTITSWEFEEGPPLAISIETRKEIGESYSAILGFFRQFELYYVAADERDVVGLRTNHRGEEVYLYRLKTPVSATRAVLLDYVRAMNELAAQPKWYNAFSHNCTTQIRRHVQNVAPRNPFSWKILVNGYLAELGYERGTIDTSLSFEELRRLSNITQRAKKAKVDASFSVRIREGLPGERPLTSTGSEV